MENHRGLAHVSFPLSLYHKPGMDLADKIEIHMNPFFKSVVPVAAILLGSATFSHAQIMNAKTDTVHVYGNCGMCETTIEKAALKKNVSEANWDRNTKMAVITYDSKKTTLNEVLKQIADAGYDNDAYRAPDAAYNKLHMCCQYDRKPQ